MGWDAGSRSTFAATAQRRMIEKDNARHAEEDGNARWHRIYADFRRRVKAIV
jgi:hypothetical protein